MDARNPSYLTDQIREMVNIAGRGLTAKEVAEALGVPIKRVENSLFGLSNRGDIHHISDWKRRNDGAITTFYSCRGPIRMNGVGIANKIKKMTRLKKVIPEQRLATEVICDAIRCLDKEGRRREEAIDWLIEGTKLTDLFFDAVDIDREALVRTLRKQELIDREVTPDVLH